MRQGASRHRLQDRGNDLYETPIEAVRALLGTGELDRLAGDDGISPMAKIREPCAGRGAISEPLKAAGHEVVAQDLVAYEGAAAGIATPIDFLLETRAPAGCRLIVTNPPYKLADAFIRHGLRFVPHVVVLLRLMALEGAGRSDLIDWHLRRVWAGRERLPAMHREGWSGNRQKGSGAPFAWFVFSADPRGDAPIELRRMSWRAA